MKRGVDYIGGGAVIVASDGHMFLSQCGPLTKNERGLCEFPGGAVELGERLVSSKGCTREPDSDHT